MDHQELVFEGAAGLCHRTVRDGPCWCVPSSLHPTAPADHSANFVGRISPSRTLYIPLRRHIRANHPRQKARYSQRCQEPITSFSLGRLPDEERGERRRRTRVTFPRPPPRRCPQWVPLPAGTSRFLTLRCQVIALHNYSGIIPPPAQRGCTPGIESSSYHAFSLSERRRGRQLLTLSLCPPRAAHLPASFCPGQGSAAWPLQERSVCPATPS